MVRQRNQSSLTSRFFAWATGRAVELPPEVNNGRRLGGGTRNSPWDMMSLDGWERPKERYPEGDRTHFRSSGIEEWYKARKAGSPQGMSASRSRVGHRDHRREYVR